MQSAANTKQASPASHKNRIVKQIFTYLIPLCISCGMIIWLFNKVNFREMFHVIRTECDFFWIFMMMLLTSLSQIFRGIRWGIQLRGAGLPKVPVISEVVSIFGAYALNLIFSEVGEAWRCVYMSKREKAPLTTVVGTDIGDRLSDFAVIVILLGLALVVARKYMEKFLSHYSMGQRLEDYVDKPWLWLGIIALLTVCWAILHFGTRYAAVRKVKAGISQIWAGLKVLATMRGKGMYLLLTLGIWGCYFLETYLCFYAFPFTRELISDPGSVYGLIPGLVVFVFGSVSMGIPSSGGLGPWNLAVMFALSLYGISDVNGTAFSMVMWSCQTMMLIAQGIFAAIYVSAEKRVSGSTASQANQA